MFTVNVEKSGARCRHIFKGESKFGLDSMHLSVLTSLFKTKETVGNGVCNHKVFHTSVTKTPSCFQLKMILIKCCDISNEVRPMEVAEPWVDCLLEEYFMQVTLHSEVITLLRIVQSDSWKPSSNKFWHAQYTRLEGHPLSKVREVCHPEDVFWIKVFIE